MSEINDKYNEVNGFCSEPCALNVGSLVSPLYTLVGFGYGSLYLVAVEYSAGGQTTLRRSSGAAGGFFDSYKPCRTSRNSRRERSGVRGTPGTESGVEY